MHASPRRRPILHLLLLLQALLPGCFLSKDTLNEPLREVPMERLEVGVTRASEVAEILGAPNEVVQLGLRSAWRYDFTASKRAGFTLIVITFVNVDTRQDRIWVFFDEQNVLSHFGSTLEAESTRYAMPWQKLHRTNGNGKGNGNGNGSAVAPAASEGVEEPE
jgi:hypothetical protein